MSYSVSDAIVDQLVNAGAKRVYGIVGDSLNPIVDAIRRSRKLQWVHVRHEEEAAFAASAEAQLSGKLAVCVGSCGPGNVHLINGLFDAHRSHAPVLAIAAQIPSHEIGTNYFQETHPDQMFRECSYYSELISNPRQMPRVMQIAMQTALSRKGVSVVAIPGDIAALPLPSGALSHGVIVEQPVTRPTQTSIKALAQLINNANKVTLFCGIGAANAHDEIIELAKTIQAPVASSLRGKPYIDYDNPYSIGQSGFIGGKAAFDAMHACDLLLLLGTDFPYESFMPTSAHVAQVDIMAENLGRRSRLDLGLWGDVKETLGELLPYIQPKSDNFFLQSAIAEYDTMRQAFSIHITEHRHRKPIRPEYAASLVDEIAAKDAIFTTDTGMCTVWAARYLTPTQKRDVIGSFNHGSMANALPQAIGAQLLYPERQVVALCGDGGIAMLMGALLTVVQYDLPLKVVVFNNSQLDLVKMEMEVGGYPEYGTDLKNPNFARLANAIGMTGVRIEDPSQLRATLENAFQARGPVLVDIVTDPNALALPPHIQLSQVRGYGISMTKLMLSGHTDEVVEIIRSNAKDIEKSL